MTDDDRPIDVELDAAAFDAMLATLARGHRILAPCVLAGKGRFSDTDAVRYGEVASLAEVEFARKSQASPKEAVFPPSQTLFHFTEESVQQPADDARGLLVFVRACDIHGFARLDQIFLGNGSVRDPFYEERRSKVKFVLMECAASMENCFCVSMGTHRSDDFAIALRRTESGVLAKIRDKDLLAALPAGARQANFELQVPQQDDAPVTLPDAGKLDRAVREQDFFNDPFWQEYAKRCIGCGRCNFSCVSCSCFSTHDVAYSDNPSAGERRRVWASCHVDRFTEMAGGHAVRTDYGSRMRYKTMHKIYDFRLRFGQPMCVGCGRCDDVCPEYIKFSACINKIARLLEERT